jgi:hypothetical protein
MGSHHTKPFYMGDFLNLYGGGQKNSILTTGINAPNLR